MGRNGRSENVFILGQDVGVYGGAFKVTEGMIERFGEDRALTRPFPRQLLSALPSAPP
jgi:pyruvate/2-oxoglutarate/acetoin dehydrogenase E1 component